MTARLLDRVVDERIQRSPEQQARYLLAHLLDFYRREDKSVWWEFFRLADLPPEDYLDEPQALADLSFVARLSMTKRGVAVNRYSFPPQECEIRERELYTAKDQKFGEVVRLDRDACIVDVKKLVARADDHPPRVFAHNRVDGRVLADSLMRLGEWVADNGADGRADAHRAARDLLLNAAPRLLPGESCDANAGETLEGRARRLARALDRGVLPVQGPPGSGKTYLGARMICELVAAGRKVAVTGPSHKVIRNLLDAVLAAAAEPQQTVRVVQKVREDDVDSAAPFRQETQNDPALEALRDGEADVLGGTAWLWAREDAADIADVLLVDEAGQMSLANTLAVAQAARSLVLLGDPQQLEQVTQGCHPEGTAVSALHHVLAGAQTLPDDRGLFLPETWRMHPRICAFTSEVFYEGRLSARSQLAHQRLEGAGDSGRRRPVAASGGPRGESEHVPRGGGRRRGARLPAAQCCVGERRRSSGGCSPRRHPGRGSRTTHTSLPSAIACLALVSGRSIVSKGRRRRSSSTRWRRPLRPTPRVEWNSSIA